MVTLGEHCFLRSCFCCRHDDRDFTPPDRSTALTIPLVVLSRIPALWPRSQALSVITGKHRVSFYSTIKPHVKPILRRCPTRGMFTRNQYDEDRYSTPYLGNATPLTQCTKLPARISQYTHRMGHYLSSIKPMNTTGRRDCYENEERRKFLTACKPSS